MHSGNSVGTIRGPELEHPDLEELPIIALESVKANSKVYGKIDEPRFPIVGWATLRDVVSGRTEDARAEAKRLEDARAAPKRSKAKHPLPEDDDEEDDDDIVEMAEDDDEEEDEDVAEVEVEVDTPIERSRPVRAARSAASKLKKRSARPASSGIAPEELAAMRTRLRGAR